MANYIPPGTGQSGYGADYFDEIPHVGPNGEDDAPLPRTLRLAFGWHAAQPPPDTGTVVRGLLHKGSITLLYGLPKSGKSFLATALALAVADPAKDDWMGNRIRIHGPVLYVACEGHGGYWKRLQAAGAVPDNFVLATGRPALIRNDDGKGYSWTPNPDDVLLAVNLVEETLGVRPVLVVIDTVFRSFGGANVNDSSHMNAYVAAAQQIADEGSAVVLVHHTTKSGNSPAGSVALMGASDTLVSVEKLEDGKHRWTVEEAKDDAASEPKGFELMVIDTIADADGEWVSSCVLVPLGADATPQRSKGPGGRPLNATRLDQTVAILARLLNQAPDLTVHVNVWRDACFREMMPGASPDAKRKAFERTCTRLIAAGRVLATGDLVKVP